MYAQAPLLIVLVSMFGAACAVEPGARTTDGSSASQPADAIGMVGPARGDSVRAAQLDRPFLVGFWGSAMQGVADGNYIAATAPYANVVMVGEDSVDGVAAKVAQAQGLGLKSIIMLQPLLFPWQRAVPHDDFRSRFDGLWQRLGALRSSIAGFYLYDEPYWRNSLAPIETQVAWQWVRAGLDQVIGHVKGVTQLPTMLLFSAPEVLTPTFAQDFLPDSLDYFGVNCYLSQGEKCTEAGIATLVDILARARKPHQRLLFSMDGYYPSALLTPSTLPEIDAALNQRVRHWAKIVAAHLDHTAGILPFVYQSFSSGDETITGARDLPMTFEALTLTMWAYRDLASCAGDDLTTSWGTVWSKAPYCQPACEGPNYVRRSLKGQVIDQWNDAPVCR